jgi:hypothetical protein
MSKWYRKTLPLTPDIRSCERYDASWHERIPAAWLREQPSLLEPGGLTDKEEAVTPYNTEYVADAQGLTGFAGMALFIAFTQKMGLSEALRRHLPFDKRKSVYSPVQLGECVVDAIVCGVPRIENTNVLKGDPLLPRARGLAQFPDHATTHRYITGFSAQMVAGLHKAAGDLLLRANRPANARQAMAVTLDFDATDAVVYGQQEEAAFGHKNKRDGHREYSIEACFLGGSKDAVHHQVRRGNVSSCKEFAPFLLESLNRVPRGMVVKLGRLDAGYMSVSNLQALEKAGIPYLMGCPCYRPLLDLAYTQGVWRKISADEEVTSFEYAFNDGVLRRVVMARHRDPKKTKAKDNGQMPLLGEEIAERELYTHFACVTTIRNKSDNVLWQSYAGRSNMENAFKESKLGFGLEALPSRKFCANQAYVAFLFLAYNMVNWFKRTVFAASDVARHQIKWLRHWLLCVPAIIVRETDHWRVHLPEGHPSLGLFSVAHRFLRRGMPIVT